MTFIQVIEYETAREEEMKPLFDEFVEATEGKRTLTHEYHARDRDRPNHYVDIVEFPSYEAAMRNSGLPETQRIARRMEELCTGETRFVNLEVVDEHQYAER